MSDIRGYLFNMAGIDELSGKFVFFIFLLVLCGNREHPFNPVQFNKEFVDSLKLGIGMEISTAVKRAQSEMW